MNFVKNNLLKNKKVARVLMKENIALIAKNLIVGLLTIRVRVKRRPWA